MVMAVPQYRGFTRVTVDQIKDQVLQIFGDTPPTVGGGIKVTAAQLRQAATMASARDDDNLAIVLNNFANALDFGNRTVDQDGDGKLTIVSPSIPNAPSSELQVFSERSGSRYSKRFVDNEDFGIAEPDPNPEPAPKKSFDLKKLLLIFLLLFSGRGNGPRGGLF